MVWVIWGVVSYFLLVHWLGVFVILGEKNDDAANGFLLSMER